jgi:glyoxylase-like metal-dependent hydrolase (beta-lactamase superfamily II)
MADLASKKVRPEDVDLVFLSHLHLDHVGWNTTDQGGMLVPTFPRAGYMVHQADLEHFRRPEIQAAARYPYMERCVEPLVSLGVLDALEGDTDLSDELRAIHTPGHTPGHMSVLVASSGEQALIQGDVLIHPAQVTEDDWCPRFDGNFEEATQTRRRILDQVESERIAVVSCHFPAPGLGRVVRYQGRRYWQVGLVSDQGN